MPVRYLLRHWFIVETSVQHNSNDHIFRHKVLCYLFDQCVQNAKTVFSISRHILLSFQQTTSDIKYAHLRCYHAGCYHESEVLLSVKQLFKETGI